MNKTMIVAAIAVLGLTACTVKELDTTLLEPAVTEAPTTTTVATTVATTPPPPPPAPRQSITDCDNVDIDATSELVPTDWDEWCGGYLFGVDYALNVDPTVCDGFWETDDQEILEMFMSEGTSFSEAIGAIDALWIVC
jgi:hypothetical protein